MKSRLSDYNATAAMRRRAATVEMYYVKGWKVAIGVMLPSAAAAVALCVALRCCHGNTERCQVCGEWLCLLSLSNCRKCIQHLAKPEERKRPETWHYGLFWTKFSVETVKAKMYLHPNLLFPNGTISNSSKFLRVIGCIDLID